MIDILFNVASGALVGLTLYKIIKMMFFSDFPTDNEPQFDD